MVEFTSLVVFLLQSAIFGIFVVAVRRRKIAAAINAFGAFLLVLLPLVVELSLSAIFGRSVVIEPVLPMWLALAGFLHSLGMLGLYESTFWWDHLTHTVSAALVAALLYAAVIVTARSTFGTGDASGMVLAVTVVFTVAIGVFWELIELVARDVGQRLDIEPLLIHYGWRDTAVDLGFDIVGALLVIGADLRIFVPMTERFSGAIGSILIGIGGTVLVGSITMALLVGLGGTKRA